MASPYATEMEPNKTRLKTSFLFECMMFTSIAWVLLFYTSRESTILLLRAARIGMIELISGITEPIKMPCIEESSDGYLSIFTLYSSSRIGEKILRMHIEEANASAIAGTT